MVDDKERATGILMGKPRDQITQGFEDSREYQESLGIENVFTSVDNSKYSISII